MSKNSQFEKFISRKKGSVIKEQFKQEKKIAKKERAAAIEKRFEEKRRLREEGKQSAVGSKQSAVGSGQSAVGSRQSAVGGRQSGVGSRKSVAGTAEQRVNNQAAPAFKAGKEEKGNPVLPERGDQLRAGSEMPLNKYVAHCGICSRRDAAQLVKQGEVTVNNQIITEPGTKILESDIVKVKGKKIAPIRNFVYILLNKPKDYITTTEDPQGRKTVLDLIRHATAERVYPIGRLDRNTSGVLLFTNDGDLAQTLSHPRHEIKKIYEVTLDKHLSKGDFDQLLNGITLEDGFIAPDALAYADAHSKNIIGIEIHSGHNRIVRRIFEKLGYDVKGLDRVMYAGLTKKNVQRGKWRLLSEKEIRILKHFNKSQVKSR